MHFEKYQVLLRKNKGKVLIYGVGGLLLFILTISVLKSFSGMNTGSSFKSPLLLELSH